MAQVTPNMQLTVWNNLSDPYDPEQLANNFVKIDLHDHSPGKGAPIDGSSINDRSITGSKLAASSVTTGVIADGTVQNSDLSSVSTLEAVNTNVIRDGAVTSSKIYANAVTSSKISTDLAGQLSIDTNTTKRKRYKYISTEESTTSTSTAVMATPDRISNLTIADPGNSGFGIIHFAYLAQWRRSSDANSGAVAEIWIKNTSTSTETKASVLMPNGSLSFVGPARTAIPAASTTGSGVNKYRPLHTINGGFVLGAGPSTTGDIAGQYFIDDVFGAGIGWNGLWGNGYSGQEGTTFATFDGATTGFVMPPSIKILAPAGIYNVEVRFSKASTGSAMFVKNRHIWAWTESFVVES